MALTLLPVLSLFLLAASMILLAAALFPTRDLIGRLPPGGVRTRWRLMGAMVAFFLVCYVGYAALFWDRHVTVESLIVPLVFFLGSSFVWMTARLSLQTAIDMRRVALLERESLTDALTGLFNRRYFDRRLGEEVALARRHGRALSVLMVDIDHFKDVNDRLGHQAGDEALVALARVVAANLRESDIAVRFGGDELVVIAPAASTADAVRIGERWRQCIASPDIATSCLPERLRGIGLTISVGVASLGGGIDSAEKLVAAADANLYLAKQRGRNRVESGS
jgi:diguanylate cyclase (GGDEF)-like protein